VFPAGGDGGKTTSSGAVGELTGVGANAETRGGAAHAEFRVGGNIVTKTSGIAAQTANPQPALERICRIRSPNSTQSRVMAVQNQSRIKPPPTRRAAVGATGRTVIVGALGAIRKIRIRPADGPATSKIVATAQSLFRFDGIAGTIEPAAGTTVTNGNPPPRPPPRGREF
jgi:hypothetical protein